MALIVPHRTHLQIRLGDSAARNDGVGRVLVGNHPSLRFGAFHTLRTHRKVAIQSPQGCVALSDSRNSPRAQGRRVRDHLTAGQFFFRAGLQVGCLTLPSLIAPAAQFT